MASAIRFMISSSEPPLIKGLNSCREGLKYTLGIKKSPFPLNYEKVEDAIKFIKENMFAVIKFYKGDAFSVEAPNFVELLITQADPGVKGNTATNAMKPATLETGAVVNVPMFVNEGDTIRVDTRTGEYMERV